MVFDSEMQRQFLLQMFKQVNFPGELIDTAYEVKKAVSDAQVREANPAGNYDMTRG